MYPPGGTHSFADGLTLSSSGQLTGAGTITGIVTNLGTVAPGNSAGTLAITGDIVSNGSGSVLAMELGGTSTVQYDRVTATGTAAIGGALQVSLLAGFTPQAGQSFTLVSAAVVSGQFASTSFPTVPGIGFHVRYTGGSVVLDALSDASDTDGDSVADTADNCPSTPNRNQLDTDQDGEGNACDLNDGINLFTSFQGTGIDWQAESAWNYNLYRGSLARLRSTGEYTQDPFIVPEAAVFCNVLETHSTDTHNPLAGQVNFYLVTSEMPGSESALGDYGTSGPQRPNAHPCP
jgi:hypothetical protein